MTGTSQPAVCLCITGWHFPREFFAAIASIEGCDTFVVSHVPRGEVPKHVFDAVGAERVLVRPNRGYDWGGYQQFLDSGIWAMYDYIFFMHDDLTIKSTRFVEATIALLKTHTVVGNGRLVMGRSYPKYAEESYAHAAWKPPSRDYQHSAVRGSYFATTRKGVEILGRFEVFWDRFRVSAGSGNWSTKASCGKWEDLVGPACFGFLSETQAESDYILEHFRGEVHDSQDSAFFKASLRNFFWNRVYARASKKYMQIQWGELRGLRAAIGRQLYPLLIWLFSGCRLRDIRRPAPAAHLPGNC